MPSDTPVQKRKMVGKPKLAGNVIANVLVITAILCIPLMYGGTLSSAYQDPVENIGRIKAAVVNQDTPYDADLLGDNHETIDVGAMVTEALVDPPADEDTGFTWTEMDKAQADRDLKNGKVRAVLYIPPGLSKDVAQIGTPDAASTQPVQLELVTDDGINYLAGTLARSVAATLEDRITSEASDVYTEALLNALGTIRTGMDEAADGAGQLADGSATLVDGLDQLKEGSATAADASGQLNSGANQLADGLGQMASQVPALQDGVNQLAAGGSQLAAGASSLDTGINQYTSGVDQVAAGAKTLRSKTPELQAGLTKLHDGSSQVAEGNAELNEQFKQISEPVSKLDGIPDAVKEIVADITESIVKAQEDLGCNTRDLHDDACAVLAFVLDHQKNIEDVVDDVADKANQAIEGVEAAQDAMGQLADGSKQVDQGIAQIQASVGKTTDTAESQTVLGAINGIEGGLAQLSGNSSTLRDGADQVASGSQQLADGTGQLKAQVPTLVDGVTRLDEGAGALADGTGQLHEGLGTLAEGTETAADGSVQIADNTKLLSDALAEGVDQIPNYTPDEAAKIAALSSSLIQAVPVREHAVANSGAGFAPMFISLALWIGGIAIFLVLPALDRRPGPGERWWMAAARPAVTAGIFGVIQATLAAVITNWAVELHAVHLGGLVGIAILASLTFIAVNQACIAMLGYRGRFVSIVLLLIQIAAMGATFPVETMPAFFNWIHPFLPMTYTQLSFRAMIAGSGVPGIVSQTILVLLLWLALAVFFVLLGAYLRTKNHPLPYDAALLPDNMPDEDKATPDQLAVRKDLKTEVREHEKQLVSAVVGSVGAARAHSRPHQRPRRRGIIAGSSGTMGTVGPRSEVYSYRDQDAKSRAPETSVKAQTTRTSGPSAVPPKASDRVSSEVFEGASDQTPDSAPVEDAVQDPAQENED